MCLKSRKTGKHVMWVNIKNKNHIWMSYMSVLSFIMRRSCNIHIRMCHCVVVVSNIKKNFISSALQRISAKPTRFFLMLFSAWITANCLCIHTDTVKNVNSLKISLTSAAKKKIDEIVNLFVILYFILSQRFT